MQCYEIISKSSEQRLINCSYFKPKTSEGKHNNGKAPNFRNVEDKVEELISEFQSKFSALRDEADNE